MGSVILFLLRVVYYLYKKLDKRDSQLINLALKVILIAMKPGRGGKDEEILEALTATLTDGA